MTTQTLSDPLAPLLANIRVVLINTQHPGNIGATARAMKNMGLSQLYLVDPQDFPADKAVWRAGHATDVLSQARVVATLDEAITGCGLVLGTSARERTIPWSLHTVREAGEHAVREASAHPVAILFGREDRGLTNEELQRCHAHLHIPANPVYSALNIATAVQVMKCVRPRWYKPNRPQNRHGLNGILRLPRPRNWSTTSSISNRQWWI